MDQETTKKETYVKQSNHYINNKDFLDALTKYRASCLKAIEDGKETPPVSNYIGDCFLRIAQHLSYLHNFINYSYIDEMRADAVENCLAAVKNFDPEKSQKPFSYFTQVTWFAFLRRIAKEKKQQKIKEKIYDSMSIDVLDSIALSQEEIAEMLNNESNTSKEKKEKKDAKKAILPIDED